ncbi:MAG: lactate racemase domain-containing protein [Planctomycetota bacterium]|jgi:nickel-dependent lactate racemase
MDLIGQAADGGVLSEDQCRQIIAATTDGLSPDGKRVLVIIPDHTRTCPLPTMTRLLHEALAGRAERVDFLIALGTHPALSEKQIDRLLGIEPGRRGEALPGSEVFNHDWKSPAALRTIGTLSADQVGRISEGRFAMDVDVTVNARVFDYDTAIVLGPVFPHEVVGFSGGAKYFFPGICGEELLNFFHWLGAVITIPKMIGVKDTPVRALLEAACEMIDLQKVGVCMVVKGDDLAGLYGGELRAAWSAAADLSDTVHIEYCDHSYDSILSCAPPMYDELWVGAKCMYKMECVVADGGELIIYAPHITELAAAHGHIIEEIGYHTLGYFLHDWERFKDYPWGVLAHSTHVRGVGEMDGDIERPRVRVTLATGIPEEVCRKINMGYRDPAGIDPANWQGFENGGGGPDGAERRLHVPKAGEMLYRLTNPPEWARV